jgi:PBP1b-binding outer membrane lipoprotein LpoB
MLNTTVSRGSALVCALALVGCFGSTPPPKSTTTTRTQTTTEQDTGQSTTSDVVETNTMQADGTQDVVRTQTTTESKPAPTP